MIEKRGLLTNEDCILLVDVIDESLQISKRSEFFLWLQGAFQSLLPHEVLICALQRKDESELHFDCFSSSRYVTNEYIKSLTRSADGLVSSLINLWTQTNLPLIVAEDSENFPLTFLEGLAQSELKNFAGHGIYYQKESTFCFFGFSRIKEEVNAKYSYLLEMMIPVVNFAYLRLMNQEVDTTVIKNVSNATQPKIISLREKEVLRWVNEGKTNIEIANILTISSNTVKNHIHNAILKLGVENRFQAVKTARLLQLI